MENKEEVLQALHEFENMTDADKVLTQELEELLAFIAQTGRVLFPWNALKPVFMFKMDRVMRDFFESSPSRNSSSSEPTHMAEFEVMRQRLLDCLDSFTSPPFTIQRLCELVVEPKRHYKNSEKFMRGVEKNVLVVSTMLEAEGGAEHPHVNSIDRIHRVPSIPNGPVTNGIMTTALPTEMESINQPDASERLLPHLHDEEYPTQHDTHNHNGNPGEQGKDDEESEETTEEEQQTERTGEQSTERTEEEQESQEQKSEEEERETELRNKECDSSDSNVEVPTQSEIEGTDSEPVPTEPSKDSTQVERNQDEGAMESKSESTQETQEAEDEPMDEN